MSLKANLRRLRTAAGFTQAELATKAGVPQSLISELETGKRTSTSFLPELAKAMKCEVRQLDPRYAAPLITSFDPDAPDRSPDPDAPANAELFPPDAIKELASKVGLGSGQTIAVTYSRDGEKIVQQDAVLDEYWRIPPPFVRGVLGARIADLLVMECDGDSMRPTLEPKERVVVDTSHKKLSPDGLYAIRNRYDDNIVKRLTLIEGDPAKVIVGSDNPAHPTVERRLDEIEIVGKVVMGMKLF